MIGYLIMCLVAGFLVGLVAGALLAANRDEAESNTKDPRNPS